jgi:hypothetical protein
MNTEAHKNLSPGALPHIAAWKKGLLEARSKAEPTNTQCLALFARQARFER